MIKNSMLQKLLFILVMVCFAGLLIINILDFSIFLKSLWQEFLNIYNKKRFLLLFLLLLSLISLLIICLRKFKPSKSLKSDNSLAFILILFFVSLIIKLIFIFAVNTKQFSDFQLFYWVTADIAKKTPKYLSKSYFSLWAYQAGFPALMSPIMKIFGINIIPLLITNCVFMSVKNIIIYLLLRMFLTEKTSRIVSCAYAFFPFVLNLSSIYTNQHLASMLLYLGVYILIYNKKLTMKRSILAGILFSLSNVCRPEAILIIASLLGYGIITTVKLNLTYLKVRLKEVFLPIGCTVLTYFICFSVISQLFVTSGLNPHGLSNNCPLYKFVVGLNHSTSGSYSQEDADYLFHNPAFIDNPDLRDEEAMRLIKERISAGPFKLGTLMINKARIMWTTNPSWYRSFRDIDFNSTFQIFDITIPLGFVFHFFTAIDFVFLILIFFFGIICMYSAFKSDENHLIQILLTLFIMVTFFAYCLVEVQLRYCYLLLPALFITAAIGLEKHIKKSQLSTP